MKMTDCLLKGKRFFCREWAFIKLLHCLETRSTSKTCGTLVMGGPGSGKTALGCELIWPTSPGKQTVLKSRVLAYHFCQAHDANSLSVVTFIKNLVSQVSKSGLIKDFNSQVMSPHIQKIIDPVECEANADEAFKIAFLEPLHSSEPPEQTLMLWVDSIDESYLQLVSERGTCSQTIAELLAAHNANFPPWLLLVCSARKQSKAVTRMFTGFRKLSLDDLRKSHVVRDVQQYILCRLDAEDGLRQHLSRDTAEMLNQLHIKSNGCFLYLEKVLDGVAESFIMLREVREIPGTLNGLYLWLCQRLFIKKHVVKIHPLLNVLLASRTPMTCDELYECMLVKEADLTREEFDRRLKLMSRILTNGLNGEQIVFHHSFSEWLLDVKHCTQKYLCNASEGHGMIAMKQLKHGKELDAFGVQELALHLVRANFPEPIQFEHLVQMLLLSGASVEKCLYAGMPKDPKALKLLTDAGARSPAMEVSITSLESEPVEHIESDMDNMGVDEVDANGRTQIHTAAYRGDIQKVSALITQGASLEMQDRSGQTALTLAARQGHFAIVTALLNAGAFIDHADHEGWTALRSAAWAGHTKVVSILLDKGAYVDHADSEQRTALRAACWGGHEDIVRLLLEHNSDVNKTDHEGRTALIAAAYMGHVEIVEQLLNHGANIDHEDVDGRTALSVACLCVPASEGHEKVVSLLLERGAEVNHTDKDGSTPLLVAAYEGHPGVCDMLLEWDADPDHVDNKNRTPLWAATSMGHEEVVRQLLFWGAAVDHIDFEGRTVLCVAAAQGSESVVRQLLDRGLDEMHRDNSGWTPLHLAAYEGHLQICHMLLEQGAKPNEVDNDGRIALIQAAQEGHLEVTKRLVEAGSNVNHRSHDGKTPLRVAAIEGHAQVLEYLLAMGADIDYKDADGRTTLYVLALDGNLEMTKIFLDNGANIEGVDNEGRTALHVASWQGNADVVRALLKHGAVVNSIDNDQRTAVQSASWQGHEAVVKLLLESGAEVDHTCNQGATALCIAAQEGHEDVVRTLLSFHANPNHADQFGRTPYRVALKSNHTNVCKILEDFGAIVPTGAKSRSNSSTSSGDIKTNTPISGTKAVPVGSSGYIGSQGIDMIHPTSPESSSDRRKSYHSNNSSSKSSSIVTSSTNQSSQGGLGHVSRFDRECLTFTQQLQQCSMGKNRSRPISRVLSPVSEPQSPVHSPCGTPVIHRQAAYDQHNINILAPSPIKSSSSKQERISATINIITNPHADMMSSVEEPVWQRNPAHPANSHNFASATNSSSSSSSGSRQHHYQPDSISPASDHPARIIMGRASLGNKSPDMRLKRNGIVTNPKVLKPSASVNHTKYNSLSPDPELDTNLTSVSNGLGQNIMLNNHDHLLKRAVSAPSGHVPADSTKYPLVERISQESLANPRNKPVRPSGLPIKKINSPHFY
ncbi:ankyrin repeat domain-containing protein 50-like isoform X1 [Biomphalaria glabrata]|uniref:Ankyrin repeat domain-containing protein 50-like isoform X1 n=1 Tax=Biomphalaria glabrata TaxID=6526 RepID=A0A9U8E989_BIOGL|nr:ankyrin repeat domain-containing protein 50-like isoform X1 [Biomphalaria glabrata]XP_013077462.2 ankyrin repeat domain-containing protein 50-like isoform X1 [Biomphalaria glabrata]KAI8734209.1 ankyrin repeat domain-containing protein 50-like [Biomphalaria glabrata]